MTKKMFPARDSVDNQTSAQYTGCEIRRIADALERILYLMECRPMPCCTTGESDLDNGISSEISPSNVNEVMTVNEAAKMLRISLPKMYDLVHQGRVHSLNVGRKILISRSSLTDLLREGD